MTQQSIRLKQSVNNHSIQSYFTICHSVSFSSQVSVTMMKNELFKLENNQGRKQVSITMKKNKLFKRDINQSTNQVSITMQDSRIVVCNSLNILRHQKMAEANSDLESIVTIIENELTLLIISSLHTLKRNKKIWQTRSVYFSERAVEFEISSGVFTETLNSLIENELVIVNTFRNRECISLPKENFQEIETERKISQNNFINLKMAF